MRDRLDEFLTFDTEVLALSCDSVYALRSFAEAEGLNFPLLSDFWPHGAVASAYEVFDAVKGAPRRSSYVVDREGRLRWSVHNANPDGRDLDEHLRELHAAVLSRGRTGLDRSARFRDSRGRALGACVIFYLLSRW